MGRRGEGVPDQWEEWGCRGSRGRQRVPACSGHGWPVSLVALGPGQGGDPCVHLRLSKALCPPVPGGVSRRSCFVAEKLRLRDVLRPVLTPLSPQGTPLKYDTGPSSAGSKKHDVRSIIGSPGRTFPPVHPLDVMADARALERACYEESLKGRPGAAGSSGGSITRGAPVIVPELGKPRQSPLAYEEHGAPFAGHLPRGSPVTTREPTPRLQEGTWGVGGWGAGTGWAPASGDCLPTHPQLRLETRGTLGPARTFHLPGLWLLSPKYTSISLRLPATPDHRDSPPGGPPQLPSCPAVSCIPDAARAVL